MDTLTQLTMFDDIVPKEPDAARARERLNHSLTYTPEENLLHNILKREFESLEEPEMRIYLTRINKVLLKATNPSAIRRLESFRNYFNERLSSASPVSQYNPDAGDTAILPSAAAGN